MEKTGDEMDYSDDESRFSREAYPWKFDPVRLNEALSNLESFFPGESRSFIRDALSAEEISERTKNLPFELPKELKAFLKGSMERITQKCPWQIRSGR